MLLNQQQIVISKTAKLSLDSNGIMRVVMLKDSEETLETAKENVRLMHTLSKRRVAPLIVDLRLMKHIDRAAMAYFQNNKARNGNEVAVALLIGSPISRLFGNFFLKVNKPQSHTRLFTSETSAIKWLEKYL